MEETPGSTATNFACCGRKRGRIENKASSAKFKGVVLQHNGNWGAQIYANHRRVWLGTFKSEQEAAMAYDSAAIKLRSGDTHRNFPWTSLTLHEPLFQNNFSTERVLDMIRDGSYSSKFADYVLVKAQSERRRENLTPGLATHKESMSYRQLFQKELTPSDVGKLNRLVIPKKYAIKYFPYICENGEENVAADGVDDVELIFYDKVMRTWKFRYCYWRSSQSFVFTRGWNRFVKEKNLRAKDVVTFFTCQLQMDKDQKEGKTFCMIDVSSNADEKNKYGDDSNSEVELNLNLGPSYKKRKRGIGDQFKEGHFLTKSEATSNSEKKDIRLFGVSIK